jgi:DNA-binding NtrC family response regulator
MLDKVTSDQRMARDRRLVVLVVEDEILVRMATVNDLNQAGFEVLEAADAEEAQLILQVRPDVDVLFTDITMPGRLNGAELASLVQKQWPNMRIILTSGVADGQCGGQPYGKLCEFVAKPYDIQMIIDSLAARADETQVA